MAVERFWDDKPAPEDEFKAEIEATQKELADLDAQKADDTVDPEVERQVLEPDEPAPEVAKEPAPVVEEKPAQRQVPLEALKEEREKRQSLERRLAELEYRLSQPAQQEPEPDKIPDVNEDPLAAIEYTARELQAMKAQQQEQAERTRLISAAQMATAEYAQSVPDYRDAYSHVLNARRVQHQLAGVPDHLMSDALARDEMEIINTAWRLNRNPGELVYEYARTYGYSGQPTKSEEAPVAAPPVASVAQEAKKAAAATTLVRGRAPSRELGVEDIVNLKGAAFDAAWEKVVASENRKVTHSVLDGLRKRR
jgi:hypothetical protein